MIGRLAVRSLTAHPVRSAVLAAGFGAGVAVMAILLGVAEVVLLEAQSPALIGGGDVVIHLEAAVPARMVMAGTLQSDQLRGRIRVPVGAADHEIRERALLEVAQHLNGRQVAKVIVVSQKLVNIVTR